MDTVVKERPILFSGAMVRALLAGTKTQTRRELKHDCSADLMADPRVKASYTTSPLMAHFKFEDGQPRESFCGLKCPYGQPGDRLWVRETHYAFGSWSKRWNEEKSRDEWHFTDLTQERSYTYRYDEPAENVGRRRTEPGKPKWWKRPSIFMPRAASRLLLEITAVRVERVQDISEADAVAEGVDMRKPAYYESGSLVMLGDHNRGVEAFANVVHGRAQYAWLWNGINGPRSWESNPWVWVVEFKVIEGGKEVASA